VLASIRVEQWVHDQTTIERTQIDAKDFRRQAAPHAR